MTAAVELQAYANSANGSHLGMSLLNTWSGQDLIATLFFE